MSVISKSSPLRKYAAMSWLVTRVNKTTYGGSNNSQVSWTDTFDGETNRFWKQQVARGIQAGTTMVAHRVKALLRPSWIQYQKVNFNGLPLLPTEDEFVQLQGGTLPSLPTSPSGLSEVLADNLAKANISRKIRKSQTTFQGGVFLGELGQTIKLITDRAIKIKRGVLSYGETLQSIRRKTRGWRTLPPREFTKRRVEAASDAWLEYQLGWAPLLSEVDAGAKALAEASVGEVRPQWVTIRAIGKNETFNSDTYNSYPWSIIGAYFHSRLRDVSTVKVRYIACVDAGISGEIGYQRLGFAPTNWLPTIWELIPYSFVIDYFSNIGQVIDSACLMRSSVRWMIKTTHKERKREYVIQAPHFPSTSGGKKVIPLGSIPGKSSVVRTWVKREPYVGSLVPDLQFNLPNHAKQVANIVGLLVMRNKLKNYFT